MKETFIVRTEWYDFIQDLEPEERAIILDNLFFYHMQKENLINLNNPQVKLVWKFMAPNLKRNIEKRDFENRETYVYTIRLKNTQEDFIKIGISYFLNKRYSDYKRYGFTVEELSIEKFTCKSDAELREYELHQYFEHLKYIPVEPFCGYTECFSLEILNHLAI